MRETEYRNEDDTSHEKKPVAKIRETKMVLRKLSGQLTKNSSPWCGGSHYLSDDQFWITGDKLPSELPSGYDSVAAEISNV